LIKNFT
ncbi:Succinyl-CoA ligase [ADP-forming] subunit beta, partial [Haemophilus influenzae]